MPQTLIQNVSDTAFWIAHCRAVETERHDALFRDPLAGLLAGERGKAIAETMPRPFITSWTVAIRTRIIDDYIRAALEDGVDTILNLGAGLDTRPYRMEVPEGLLWVEADYPHMMEWKEERLVNEKPRCRLERVKSIWLIWKNAARCWAESTGGSKTAGAYGRRGAVPER